MARVIVSRQAQADTAGVLVHLVGAAGRSVADRYAAAFESLYARLQIFPDSGARRPAVSPFARIGIVAPYLVIYEFDAATSDVVTVLRIVHGRRRLTGAQLARDPLKP